MPGQVETSFGIGTVGSTARRWPRPSTGRCVPTSFEKWSSRHLQRWQTKAPRTPHPFYADAVRAAARGDDACLADGRSWGSGDRVGAGRGGTRAAFAVGRGRIRKWTWGAIHRTRPRHPLSRIFPDCAKVLDPPGLATHGDSDTPLAGRLCPDRGLHGDGDVSKPLHPRPVRLAQLPMDRPAWRIGPPRQPALRGPGRALGRCRDRPPALGLGTTSWRRPKRGRR